MWKKILGYFLITYSLFIMAVGLYTTFNKSPYCEWLAQQYDNPYHDYTEQYVEEFKIPSGSCYNHFMKRRLLTTLISLGLGMWLVQKDKTMQK